MRPLLLLHAGLMLLACTDWTIATFLSDGNFRVNFYQYTFRSGFGAPYVSDYRFLTVLTYLASYAVGTLAFWTASRRGRPVAGTLGAALSAIGFTSFLIEASHWLTPHHRSWIISAPIVMLVLTAIALWPVRQRDTELNAQPLSGLET